jgi:hypothetical protein
MGHVATKLSHLICTQVKIGERYPHVSTSMRKTFAILGIAALLVSCASVPIGSDVPNFKAIDAAQAEYRGGQPTTLAQWQHIRSLGVTNVTKLNPKSEGSDDLALQVGMTVHYFPIDLIHQTLVKPSRLLMSNIVASITPGTYVHCEHGQDRTGLAVGCKRVWVDGWSKAASWNEMQTNGFHRALHALDDFWEDNVK